MRPAIRQLDRLIIPQIKHALYPLTSNLQDPLKPCNNRMRIWPEARRIG